MLLRTPSLLVMPLTMQYSMLPISKQPQKRRQQRRLRAMVPAQRP